MGAILNIVVDGILSISSENRIESINPAVEKIFGYSRAEIVGQNISMLMPFERRTSDIGRELDGKRKDGSVVPIELTVSELLLDDRHCFTVFVRDITERKQSEEIRREFGARLVQAQEEECALCPRSA